MPVGISVEERDGVTVVAITGDLDMGTAPQLLDTGTAEIDAGHNRLVLDLSGVTFCDSTGLGVFVRLKKRVDATQGALALAGPTDNVRTILDVTGLAEVIGVHPDSAAATAALRPN